MCRVLNQTLRAELDLVDMLQARNTAIMNVVDLDSLAAFAIFLTNGGFY